MKRDEILAKIKEKYTSTNVEEIKMISENTIVCKCKITHHPSMYLDDILKPLLYEVDFTSERYIVNDEIISYGELMDMQRSDEISVDETYELTKIVTIIIKPYSLQEKYKEWVEEEKGYHYLTVKDLIHRLQKTDQDAIIAIEDREWGGFDALEYSDKPMHITKSRDCPDCNNGCCNKCEGREIFERKYVLF